MSRTVSRFTAYTLIGSSLLAPTSLLAEFSNIIAKSGLDHIQAESKSSKHGGAAAADVNGDGYTDILVARDDMHPLLFINQGNGTFRDETSSRGLDTIQNIAGFGVGDLDNDGDQDIFISPRLGFRFYLFINDGSGVFAEEAEARGAAIKTTIEPHRGFSVGLVDYDLDGYLDIYASEWGVPSNDDNAKHSVLLRNLGEEESAHFENVTEQAGLTQPTSRNQHFVFSSGWGDFDDDGWPDLVLVSDFGTSLMYWNNGDGTFQETTEASKIGLDENGMGVAIVDYDRDGKLDIFVSSIYDRFSNDRNGTHTGNKLYKNLGDRTFTQTANGAGLSRSGWGWGASFFEYENDGNPDLVVTNGSIVSAGTNPNTTPYVDAVDDPTTLFLNLSNGTFADKTIAAGITDRELGKAIVVFDHEKDGDEDLFITNSGGHPILYQNDASTNGNNYLRLSFEGTVSNRDGYGCIVKLTTSNSIQTNLYNPTNAYIGQREPYLHFGLGTATTADVIEITWPSGIVQTLTNIPSNQVLDIVEPFVEQFAPTITTEPIGRTYEVGEKLELHAEASGHPTPVVVWEKDGIPIEGATETNFRIKKITPYDAGTYRAKFINPKGITYSNEAIVSIDLDISKFSIARIWNDFLLDAIRKDFPDPTIHSRNLYHTSAAMWDAFWACESGAWPIVEPAFTQENLTLPGSEEERQAFQEKAISHAAYSVLVHRYQNSPGKESSLYNFAWLMEYLGYDSTNLETTGNSAEAVGNRIAESIIQIALSDGSNEANNYADTSGYEAANDPMILELSGTDMEDLNRWQPLAFEYLVLQNGIHIGKSIQTFLGVNWREVDTFAISKDASNSIAIDPGPPPQFMGETHQEFVDAVVEVVRYSAMLDPNDGEYIDISPSTHLNNTLGENDGTGRAINPITQEPYPENRVKRADYGRILAEFWADGPASETPPGHWNTLLNQVSEHPQFERRFAGQGDQINPLEWDIRAYLTLNGAMHDAAVAAWTLKRQYDYSRPISMIRHMGGYGQSSDPNLPSYNENGLPIVDDLIELITAESSQPGERHAHLSDHVDEIAIRCWAGEPENNDTQFGGVGWILAEDWFPYQRSTFVSPAFAAYVSGHSTFSRAGAEVLTLLTGTPFFPGGIGEYHFVKNDFLEFEAGPSEDVVLQWATYYDAADEAGESRLYGGIHVPADDFIGRQIGARVGLEAFLKVQRMVSSQGPERGLLNLSSRSKLGTGENVTITGFVMDGTDKESILIRSIGPGLADQNITNYAENPRFDLYRFNDSDTGSTLVIGNDNWEECLDPDAVEDASNERGAFALKPFSQDAAELTSLNSGVYTAITSNNSTSGEIALTEIYGENLLNISTRAQVNSESEGSLIAGFYLESSEPTTLLIRGIGPALAQEDVSNFLEDPIIYVYRMSSDSAPELVAYNDNWQESDTASLSQVAADYIGATPLNKDSKDAALLLQLPQGLYTVIVQNVSGQGVSLAEVYHVE
ncbi:FG-GAP-like repeat-containing protein [Puniceicoccaceae bacterium K14]|nr:FG-GAP-like repeat-containing protein [Puniceicoccaceae bacterium K14]